MLRKWLIVITLPFLFQIVLLVVLFRSQADRKEAQMWAMHTVEVIAQTESINSMLNEAYADVLGRVVTGVHGSGRVQEIREKVRRQFATIHDQVRDNPKNLALIDDTAAMSQRFLQWLETADRIAESGHREQMAAYFQDSSRDDSLSEIRARLDVILAAEQTLNRLRRASLTWIATIQNWVLLYGSILTLVLVATLIVIFTRGFIQRMDLLANNARRLGEGEVLLEPLKGNDEISLLDRAFRAMAKALAERDRENEMFIFSVSHDLRSPLVNLQGFSRELTYSADDLKTLLATVEAPETIRAKLSQLIDRDMKDSIHFIQNAVVRLAAIIDSLLRLSRAGRVEYQMESLEMNGLVRRVIESQKGSTGEKAAEIEVADLPLAWGDKTAVEQIFSNLLTNAVKYLDASRPGRIEVGVSDSGGDGTSGVTYYVRDNGLGIPAAHQGKLFIAFQRLHPSVAEGEGVGLALVRRIVERHGGRIWAESADGVGTTFFVTLPAPPRDGRAQGDSQTRQALNETPSSR